MGRKNRNRPSASAKIAFEPVKYDRLVVPKRMRSNNWKYFGFPGDTKGHIITKNIAICTVCHKQLQYSFNTSNLAVHLNARHKKEYAELKKMPQPPKTLGTSRKRKVRKISSDTAVGLENITIKEHVVKTIKPSAMFKSGFDFIEVVINDLIAPQLLEKGRLPFVLSQLGRKDEIPSSDELNATVSIQAAKYRDDTINELAEAKYMSLSVEEWKPYDDASYVSFSVNYLKGNTLCTKLLSVRYGIRTCTIEYWLNILNALFEEWNLARVMVALVSTNNEPLLQALKQRSVNTVPCFLWFLQSSFDSYFTTEYITDLISRCRNIMNVMGKVADVETDDVDVPLTNVRPSWINAYQTLTFVNNHQEAVHVFLRQNGRMCDAKFADEEWHLIHELARMLKNLMVVTSSLIEEKVASISLLKPLMNQVVEPEFELTDEDSEIARSIKQNITVALNEVYGRPDIHHITKVASSLDPRFKAFSSEEVDYELKEQLIDMVTDVIESDVSTFVSMFGPEMPCSNRSSINLLFQGARPKNRDCAMIEISAYMNNSNALLDQCPLEWWDKQPKCMNLKSLALSYHCIPAIIVPYGCHSITEYARYQDNRTNLPCASAEQLLFLYHNKERNNGTDS